MSYETVLNFFKDNFVGIVILIAMTLFVARKKIATWYLNRKQKQVPIVQQEEEEYYVPEQPSFVMDNSAMGMGDFASGLKGQYKNAESKIREIERAGKEVVKEEKELDKYYRQQKMMMQHKRNNVVLQYQTWRNHHQNVGQMISNQEKMEQEMKKVIPMKKK